MNTKHYVTITARTWDKDSHGGQVRWTKLIYYCEKEKRSANGSPLLSVVQIDGKYYIDNCFQKKTQNCYSDFKNTNWIPVKYLNQDFPFKSCHKLSVGDVIKFGRLVFQVRVIHNGFAKQPKLGNNISIIQSINDSIERLHSNIMNNLNKINPDSKGWRFNGNWDPSINNCAKTNAKVVYYMKEYLDKVIVDEINTFNEPMYSCRICLSSDCSTEDPLITPCNCSGTVQYIHLACVKECLKSKMVCKKTEFYTSMAWENISCELCKVRYPDSIILRMDENQTESSSSDRIIDLIEIDEEESDNPYIMLDCINVATFRKESSKVVYFIKMVDKTVILGRGQAANVRLADISISRKHTIFRLSKENEIYITDESSKFGTLILQQTPILLDTSKGLTNCIQNGRTFISVCTKPFQSGCCCFKPKIKNLLIGVDYKNNSHTFPEYFKKLIRDENQSFSPKPVSKFVIKDSTEMNRSSDSRLNENSKNDTFMSVSPRKRAENQRNTTFEREIIPEEDEEKEKDQVDSNRVSKEEFKINPNFVQTFNDEKHEKDSNLEHEFEKLNIEGSLDNMNELNYLNQLSVENRNQVIVSALDKPNNTEEDKDEANPHSNLHKILPNALSPLMHLKHHKFGNKDQTEIQNLMGSFISSPNPDDFFTGNNKGWMESEGNELNIENNHLRDSQELGQSIKLINLEKQKSKESCNSLIKKDSVSYLQ